MLSSLMSPKSNPCNMSLIQLTLNLQEQTTLSSATLKSTQVPKMIVYKRRIYLMLNLTAAIKYKRYLTHILKTWKISKLSLRKRKSYQNFR
jgi:hypothetical protein